MIINTNISSTTSSTTLFNSQPGCQSRQQLYERSVLLLLLLLCKLSHVTNLLNCPVL